VGTERGLCSPRRVACVLEKGIGKIVLRRFDGRRIYATRDIWAIKLRWEIFDPTDISYVVG
jgi:arginyl-tRNA synthetase